MSTGRDRLKNCFMRENEVSRLVQEIEAGQGRVLLVSGESGVGKTTIIAEALSRTKNTESTIFYPFGEDPIQFKIFLNELLIAEMAKRPLLSRLFRKRFRLVGAHVQPLKGFSIDFYNRDYDDAPAEREVECASDDVREFFLPLEWDAQVCVF